MSKEEILTKLEEIFREVFMEESITLTPETQSSDIDDWDSLNHVLLLSQVEGEFGMKFQAQEARCMKNVGEMVNIIQERIQA